MLWNDLLKYLLYPNTDVTLVVVGGSDWQQFEFFNLDLVKKFFS